MIKDIVRAVLNELKGKPTLFCIQIEPCNEYNSPKRLANSGDFIIYFHKRQNISLFGFKKTKNTEYILSKKHSFKVFQLLNRTSKSRTFHMHSSDTWIIGFYFNDFVEMFI